MLKKPADAAIRARALDPSASFLVQAPAGSGKTELLTRRFLALLACVDSPEEILAITFTRKAAAEMKSRVARALDEASGAPPDDERAKLARAALARSDLLGWDLAQNPSRLTVTTIDGFCRNLVTRMPWLSRMGTPPEVADDAEELYLEAVRRVFAHLEEGDDYAHALGAALEYFDNRAYRFKNLLVEFLKGRDRWLRRRGGVAMERAEMERALAELLEAELAPVADLLYPHFAEMKALGLYASAHMEEGTLIHLLRDVGDLSAARAGDIASWRGFGDLFLTRDGQFRKSPNVKQGFPTDAPDVRAWKGRFADLVAALSAVPRARESLFRAWSLPDPAYGDDWEIIKPLLKVMELALACLWEVMRERRQTDFSETAQRGLAALEEADAPSELLLALDRSLRHILVDEFQDTSRLQYDLLERLVSGWTPGDGRTLFLVGDPMQSIYRFREAEVALFLRAAARGVGPVTLTPLALTANFRSEAPLVDWYNDALGRIFPPQADPADAAVPYSPCEAHLTGGDDDAVRFHATAVNDPLAEAVEVADEVERARQRGTVAILVRSRSHLDAILPELTRRGVPWRGEELARLGDRRVVSDLRTLAAALLDPADRLAWFSVLRAPWCGLTLADLHALAAADERPIPQLLREGGSGRLSPEGAARLEKAWNILSVALAEARRRPFRPWLEGVWLSLGAPAYWSAQEQKDADAALGLLETLAVGGNLPPPSRLDREFSRLYSAPDPEVDPEAPGAVAVMTIHKAKGLEFDTVLLPGLGRRPRTSQKPLLAWEQAPSEAIVLGPAPPRMKNAKSPILDFLAELAERKDANERTRLLYVAATRAKQRLRLWGVATPNAKGEAVPEAKSLLSSLWPAVKDFYQNLPQPAATEVLRPERPLRVARLPENWSLPPLPRCPVPSPPAPPPRREPEEELEYLWAREERKHIGTLAHQLLERISREGIEKWDERRVTATREAARSRLSALGIPSERLAPAAEEALTAVRRTLADPRGRWILAARDGAASEFGLTGTLEGGRATGIMDRTFLEGETRWIVDFKITPHEGGGLEAFLKEQVERHTPQLARYARLARLNEPGRAVRAALYFPLLQRFLEVDA